MHYLLFSENNENLEKPYKNDREKNSPQTLG
jgi:hypothetical protein